MLLALAPVLSCGTGSPGGQETALFVRIPAGKLTWIRVPAAEESVEAPDSSSGPGSPVSMDLPSGPVSIRAFLIQDHGCTPEERVADLIASGVDDAIVLQGSPRTAGVMSVVGYTRGDTCRLERLWPRGAGEAVVLSVQRQFFTPAGLFGQTERLLERSSPEAWTGLRTPLLSDRSLREMQAGFDEHDSGRLPSVRHALEMTLVPQEQAFEVVDTFTVDFNGTAGITQTRLAMPHIDGSAQEMVVALEGTCVRETDSVLCMPDPETGIFAGMYQSKFEDYYREDGGFVRGQMRLSSSFSCGEWFYPGAETPSEYDLSVSVPFGGSFYCPLQLVEYHSAGSNREYRFTSPPGGISDPLSWASGELESMSIASGRSRFVHVPVDEAESGSLATNADILAGTLWDRLGFDGASLDVVMVGSIDRPVLASGTGCLLISADQLSLIDGYSLWDDSLMNGLRPSGPRVVARAARSLLAMSSYLPEEFSAALSAWSVFLFVERHGSVRDAENILECFMRYYLSSTSGSTATEFSIGDSELPGSELAEPVLMGKAPVVLTMFSRFVPGFDPGLQSALARLRHPGVALLSIASMLGTPSDPSLSDLYWDWISMPGVPQVLVRWRESSGRVDFTMEQLQPGRDFPLPLGRMLLFYENGGSSEGWIYGPAQDGGYWAFFDPGEGGLSAIDVSPSRHLPADIVYERQH